MHKILRFLLLVSAVVMLSPDVQGQEAERPAPVQIRAVLHDPVRPVASLYYPDKTGAALPVAFRPQDLTEAMYIVPLEGSLVLYDKAVINPENPEAGVVARAKLSPDIRRAIIVVLPAPADSNNAYRMVVIDDSEKSFPFGESRVLSLLGVKVGIQAGEHTVLVQPMKLSSVPMVKKVNDFNMAQTNFHYQQENGATVVFAERQLQYVHACRRLFIIHATPGALQPTVTTIVDTYLGQAPQRE